MMDINLTAEQFEKLKAAYALPDALEQIALLIGKPWRELTPEQKDDAKQGHFDGSYYQVSVEMPEPFSNIMNIKLPDGLSWENPFDTPYKCGFLTGLMLAIECDNNAEIN